MSTATSPEPDQSSDPPDPSSTRPSRFRLPSSPKVRILAAAVSLALVVALLGVVLAEAAGNRAQPTVTAGQITGSGKPTQPVSTWWPQKPTFTPTLPWGTPTPTLPPTSSAITSDQAWGPNAAKVTFNTQLDATHYFNASHISWDGKSLYGVRMASPTGQNLPPGDAGILDIATRQFTPIGLSETPGYALHCCQTDGHYLLAAYDTAPGETCGLCHLTYYVYDLDTRTLRLFTTGSSSTIGLVESIEVDHGLAVIGNTEQIWTGNLATGAFTQVQLPAVGGQTYAQVFAYTWPYVVYYDQPEGAGAPPAHFRAHSLATGQDVALPQVDALQTKYGIGMAVIGETLFVAQTVYEDAQSQVSESSLYEDDAFFTANTPAHLLASYTGESFLDGANLRVVNIGGFVWDRVERRFVQVMLAPLTGGMAATNTVISLTGPFLAAMQPADPTFASQVQQVAIYDTDTLSTTPSA